jgi:alpha-tubulin suppressor-like RCC1 family protein
MVRRLFLTIAAMAILAAAPFSPSAAISAESSPVPCYDALGNSVACAPKVGVAVAPARVMSIWGGARHGIALQSDGTVWTWGVNYHGMLGDGTLAERHTPIQVHGPGNIGMLSSITAVMGGEQHNLALKSDGTVWAWGWNAFGQLGDGTYTDSYIPVQVSGLISATALGGRGYHSLAIGPGGTVWDWGLNSYGQLGITTAITRSAVPTQVLGLGGVLTVTGGYNFSLALMPDLTLRAWGCDTHGELGDGTNTSTSVPVPVSSLSNVTQVSAGWKHVVALESDGTVWTWGQNDHGQLGNGIASTTGVSVPVQVSGISNVIAVSGGDCHTTALRADGTVWAWGCNNSSGNGAGNDELGDGTNIERHTPVQVMGLTDVIAITARDYHNYAIKSDGTVWAWGWNINGQLGDNTTIDRNVPVQVQFPPALNVWLYLPLVSE